MSPDAVTGPIQKRAENKHKSAPTLCWPNLFQVPVPSSQFAVRSFRTKSRAQARTPGLWPIRIAAISLPFCPIFQASMGAPRRRARPPHPTKQAWTSRSASTPPRGLRRPALSCTFSITKSQSERRSEARRELPERGPQSQNGNW